MFFSDGYPMNVLFQQHSLIDVKAEGQSRVPVWHLEGLVHCVQNVTHDTCKVA